MKKVLKSIYNFLMMLKRYHATHALIIPNALYMILTHALVDILYIIGFIQSPPYPTEPDYNIFFCYLVGAAGVVIAIPAMLIFFALFLVINILVRIIRWKPIYVKSNFLLNNKFYNVIYLLTILHILILIVTYFIDDYILRYLLLFYISLIEPFQYLYFFIFY